MKIIDRNTRPLRSAENATANEPVNTAPRRTLLRRGSTPLRFAPLPAHRFARLYGLSPVSQRPMSDAGLVVIPPAMHTDPPELHPFFADTDILWVNGMRTPPADRYQIAVHMADTLGRPVHLLHNPTEGPPVDLLEAYRELYTGVPTPVTQQLTSILIHRMLTWRANPGAPGITLIGHSQGSIQIVHAVRNAIDQLRLHLWLEMAANTRMRGMPLPPPARLYAAIDAQIRDMLTRKLRIILTGSPVDPEAPYQPITRLSDGTPLSHFLAVQDVMLHPSMAHETVTGNWILLRHPADPIATTVREFRPTASDLHHHLPDFRSMDLWAHDFRTVYLPALSRMLVRSR